MSVNALGATRIHVGSLPVDSVDFEGAIASIEQLIASGQGGTVFTPNVDHVVLAEDDAQLRAAYAEASLSLVDGTPVLWASRLLRTPLPTKVSGSDLIGPLLKRAAERGYRVYFLGGTPGVPELARTKLELDLPELKIVGIDTSKIEVYQDTPEARATAERVAQAKPDIVLVCLGAPKQEIWSQKYLPLLKPAVLIGVGGTLDFVAGIQSRSPRWMSRIGMEWLYRLARDPRRLAARYLLRDPRFFWILLRQLLKPARG